MPAQAPAAGPLVLLLPASTRATGLGNAWVAGRDEYALFYNPAQIASTSGIFMSVTRYGAGGTSGALTSGASVGSLTFAWGAQLLEFKAKAPATYPFQPGDLAERGERDALSLVAGVGANYVFKGFRTGLGIKYAEDRVEGIIGSSAYQPLKYALGMADVGVSHSLLSGTVAATVQNIGDGGHLRLPTRTTVGWSRQKSTDQFDFAVGGQLSVRNGWVGGGGGVEASYGWIEGWSASIRAGARRMETAAQRPVSFGGTLNGDRLSMDYAIEFFEHQHYAHHLSLRWR
jgi:hypothetical protein